MISLMYQSSKFKFINNTIYRDYIPKTYNDTNLLFKNKEDHSSIILRSALEGEAQTKLKSGLSLTVANIKSHEDFELALKKVKEQRQLAEWIVQEQKFFHTHLTIYIESSFVFGEVTGSDEFFILSDLTQTGDVELIKKVKPLIDLIKQTEKESVLIELGLGSGDDIWLFQLMTVINHPIQDYIKNDLFHLLIQKKDIYLKSGFWNLIKTELLAYRIRKGKHQYSALEKIFFNWISLLHYFRLYCMQNKLSADSIAWQKFLTSSFEGKGRILSLGLEHIKISSNLRSSEEMPEMPAGFNQTHKVFIGKGSSLYIVGENLKIITDMSISKVQKLEEEFEIIISDYSSLLSHPILLSIERGKFFVGGLSLSYLESLSDGDQVRIDFDKRQIELINRKN